MRAKKQVPKTFQRSAYSCLFLFGLMAHASIARFSSIITITLTWCHVASAMFHSCRCTCAWCMVTRKGHTCSHCSRAQLFFALIKTWHVRSILFMSWRWIGMFYHLRKKLFKLWPTLKEIPLQKLYCKFILGQQSNAHAGETYVFTTCG